MDNSPPESILVVLPFPEPTEQLELLKSKFPTASVKYIQSGSFGFGTKLNPIDKEIFQNVTILFSVRVFPSSKEEAPKLKYVHLLSAGVEHIISHPFFVGTDIPFTNASGVHGPQISEWVIMTALVHHHKYNLLHDAQKEHSWAKQQDFLYIKDLPGQRIGILGYGGIGRQSKVIPAGL
jgi:phosphoglycerate dehydrogenase-like enzyme